MNWYGKIILSQIWESNGNEFEDELKTLYEMEYKLHALNNFQFNGMPKRRENIIERVEQRLEEAIDSIKDPLERTFEKWLKSHALLDSRTWAEQRMEPYYEEDDRGEQDFLEGVVNEYKRYKNNNQPWRSWGRSTDWDSAFSEMINEALAMEDKFPSLQKIKSVLGDVREEELREEFFSEGLEQFGENYIGKPFATEEEAEAYILDQSSEIDLVDYIYGIGIEGFIHILSYNGISLNQFLIELNQNLVFPLWYNYWSAMGIDNTRENIEEIYKRLISDGDLSTQSANINIALNTAHQNGEMIDYLESYGSSGGYGYIDSGNVKSVLDDLSSNKYVAEWNDQLEEIGVVVPESVKEQSEYSIQK